MDERELEARFKAAFVALVETYVEKSEQAGVVPNAPWTTRLIIPIYRSPHGVEASLLHAVSIRIKDPMVYASLSYKKPQSPQANEAGTSKTVTTSGATK
jgi:hypothetical protein